ncbi:hypothetical protein B0T22DRAFT_477379 [Podospora appendiculata]|uniref:Transmembrane and coiled-coil domain-containing protein n=1 Tax=Podospora appendiculata TaxID=314037 RepID=A0AAE0XK60_9PEZI|nr:hypothetical protein B0T22DRAFT_477379 [Podospora appendiculata]
MAPLASEPRQILTVLNLAKRKALYTLVAETLEWQRAQLVLKISDSDAPLFAAAAAMSDDDIDMDDLKISHKTAAPRSQQNQQHQQRTSSPRPELLRLRNAALAHFDAWRRDVLAKLKEVLSAPDDAHVIDARRKRTERLARLKAETPAQGEDLIDFFSEGSSSSSSSQGVQEAKAQRAAAVARLQEMHHPIPTRLVSISEEDREEVLSCVLLLLLATGKYAAEARALVVYLASALGLPVEVLDREEREIAMGLVEAAASSNMSADKETLTRKEQSQAGRFWKVGLASVAGAAIIGVTGGLAAPVVAGAIGGLMGSVGLGGVASFLGIFWMNGALVGTLFGAFGARMTGEIVDQYAKEVEDFCFIPLKDQCGTRRNNNPKEARRLRVTIGVNGWLESEDDVTKPWRHLDDDSEVFALRYEMRSLMSLGRSLQKLVSSYAWSYVKVEILKRTVLASLWGALWPAYLVSAAASIDNPFSLAKNRSEKAGEILADALINRVQGERPVTLIGYSLGARVVYACLRSLAARRAFGLVDTVVFIGAPVPSNTHHWQVMRSVVSGKMFNVYSENDYLLAFLYRATSIQLGVAGLQAIKDIEGVENVDLSESVSGHMRYPRIIDKILARCGFPVVPGFAGPIEREEDIKIEDLDLGRTGTLIDLGLDVDNRTLTEAPPGSASDQLPSSGGDILPSRQDNVSKEPSPGETSPKASGPDAAKRDSVSPRESTARSTQETSASPPPVDSRWLDAAAVRKAIATPPSQRNPRNAVTRAATSALDSHDPLSSPLGDDAATSGAKRASANTATAKRPAAPTLTRAATTSAYSPRITAPSKTDNPPLLAESRGAPVHTQSLPVFTSSYDYGAQQQNDLDSDSDNEDGYGIKMVDNDDDFEYLEPMPMED